MIERFGLPDDAHPPIRTHRLIHTTRRRHVTNSLLLRACALILARAEASTVGAWILLQPVIAAIAAWTLLDVPLRSHALLGGAVVAAGVLLVTRSGSTRS